MSNEQGDFRWEDPCFAHLKFEGRITEAQIDALFTPLVVRASELPYVLMTVDITEMSGASPESRRQTAKLMEEIPPRAIAVIGGTFSQRMVSKLVLKATELLGKTRQISAFFAEPDAARTWLEEQGGVFDAEIGEP